MGSDDDEEELAMLRAQRAARTGAPVASLTNQRMREEKAAAFNAQFLQEGPSRPSRDEIEDEEVGPRPPPSEPSTSLPYYNREQDDEDEDGPVVVDEVEVDEAEVQEGLRAHFPMSFGGQEQQAVKLTEVHDKHKRDDSKSVGPPRPPGAGGRFGPPRPPSNPGGSSFGPPRPPPAVAAEDLVGPPRPPADEDNAEEAGPHLDGDEDEDDPWNLPISHEANLGGHNKAVVCMDVEHSGSRIVTGSLDYTICMYDFNGMKSDLKAFRELEAQEGNPVYSVSWSPSGDSLLVVTGSARAKIFDRDGRTKGEFIRGDMYIRDMKNTKGHVSGCTAGQWHPLDRATVMTSSEDGTVRLWDAEELVQKTVIKPTLTKVQRTSVSTCRWSGDGRMIAAGLVDGSIQLWSVSGGGKFGTSAAVSLVPVPRQQMIEKQNWTVVSRPSHVMRPAHQPDNEITNLTFSRDGITLLSRGMDATVKLWDLRRFSKPMAVFSDLPCAQPTTNVIFSPDEQLILTGIAAGQDEQGGAIVFIDKAKQQLVRKVGMPSNVTALSWHPRLNQIFAGIGNRKTGSTRVLYDTTFSERGIMQAVSRAPRKANPFDFVPPLLIRESGGGQKRRRDAPPVDPRKATRPDTGAVQGVGKQGAIGSTGGTLLTQHLMKQRGKLKRPGDEMDPREAILRHGDAGSEFQKWTDAYAETQPKPIFHEEEEEGESEED